MFHYHDHIAADQRQPEGETDAGSGAYGICRAIDASRSPSPDPGRWRLTRVMIDRHARSTMAELVRHLIAGLITNDQFEARIPVSADPALAEVFHLGFWPLYSDHSEHRLTGSHAICRDDRREAVRYILFLEGEGEYLWPLHPPMSLFQILADIFSLGFVGRRARRQFERLCAIAGDTDVWPFISRADYEAALLHPPYLRA